MNCKPLFKGALDSANLRKVSPRVRKVLCAAAFDNFHDLGINKYDLVHFLDEVYWESPISLAKLFHDYGLYYAEVVKQYPSSPFFTLGNYRVMFHKKAVYSTYVP